MSWPNNILDWQRRLCEQPQVFEVLLNGEPTGNVYATSLAAAFEVDWHRRRGARRVRLRAIGHVHTEELSRKRWRLPDEDMIAAAKSAGDSFIK